MVRLFRFANDAQEGSSVRHLSPMRQTPVAVEREIQRLCEANLEALFGLELIASEFTVWDLRLDTLAFDPVSSSYVIIEYKRGAHFSVIDQGFAYLATLGNYPDAFLQQHAKSANRLVSRDEIDWRKSRVFFVAPEFTTYQKKAVSLRDHRLELYQISFFDECVVGLERVGGGEEPLSTSLEGSDGGLSKASDAPSVEAHLSSRPKDVADLYRGLEQQVLALGDEVSPRAVQLAIYFEIDGAKFAEVVPQQRQLTVHLDKFDGDPRGFDVRDLQAEGVGWMFGTGPYKFVLKPGDNVENAVDLIRQSFVAVAQER